MALLIITSTVYVNSGLTVLKNSDERIKQYIASIQFYLDSVTITNIVVCDNSNFDYSKHCDLFKIAANKKIEFLCFEGNKHQIKAKGKGYGEGEIMSYVLTHSKLMKCEQNSFYKITGRIFLRNIDSIVKSINTQYNYFQGIGINPFRKQEKVDTRFYHCKKDIFRISLKHAYKSVNDNKGYYLEHAYYHCLNTDYISYRNFTLLPSFGGISGSTGKNYESKKYRWFFLKSIYSIMTWVGVI